MPSNIYNVQKGAFANEIFQKLKVKVRVISQSQEASLGFMATKSKQPKISTSSLMVWDIGGGSMQISYLTPKGENNAPITIYKGQMASVPFKELIISKIKNLDPKKISSPNPIGLENLKSSLKLARDFALKDIPKKMLERAKNSHVVGIGGVHYYSIKGQLKKYTKDLGQFFNRNQILSTIQKKIQLTDKELNSKYADTDITNLILVLGHMEAMGINKVHPMKINMGHGAVIYDSFWK